MLSEQEQQTLAWLKADSTFGVSLAHTRAAERELLLSLGGLGKLGELGEDAVGARTTNACGAEGKLDARRNSTGI